jgi:uncharacterized iron-regulated membrane protein
MRTAMLTKATVSILVGLLIAPAATAAAQNGAAAPHRAGAATEGTQRAQIVLRRDGDRAVAFDPVVGAGHGALLRRDGSKAVPFLAQVGPPAVVPAADGFDWSDALIGAAAAYALILLASGAVLLVRRRRPPRRLAQRPA